MIEINQLCRTYGNTVAVDQVSFKIELGEVVGLLGHNGAGKSTIMKMMTGYLEPSAGSIKIDGLDVYENRLGIQAKLGYLPENSPLYADMTVLDYLRFAASLKRIAVSSTDERITYALAKTRIVEVAQKKIATLSRGYKQRVGVAQAILNSPSIIILDEPTNGLDPSQILEMRALIKELAKSATIIISTHILQEVEAMCSRVIIINKGKIALDSSMDMLRESNLISLSTDQDIKAVLAEHKTLKLLNEKKDTSGKYHYTIQSEHDELNGDIPELVNRLTSAKYKVYSVHPFIRNLETVFWDINTGKHIA